MTLTKNYIGEILFVIFISSLSFVLTLFTPLHKLGISPLIVAIVIGFSYTNILTSSYKKVQSGLDFCTTKILRIAIILYGFNLTFQDIFHVGVKGILASSIVLISTFLLGLFIAKKILKLDTQLSLLICSGSSICGAAAVLATESLIKSDASKTAIAIATVVIFGTLSMFLYPLAYHWGLIALDASSMGIYIGSTLHEVAHVVTAGSSISQSVASDAIIVKMLRVMMIAPVLIVISFFINKESTENNKKIVIPWFAVLFIFVAGFNSLELLSQNSITYIKNIDSFLLTMAMVALGMKTKIKELIKVGHKPFLMAFLLFIWLIFGGYGINYLIGFI